MKEGKDWREGGKELAGGWLFRKMWSGWGKAPAFAGGTGVSPVVDGCFG